MLASDSDSDFEYPEGANDSDASTDSGLQGRLALGVDPQATKSYDGRSAPENGSQYLVKVMKERKSTPKVAFADASKLPKRRMETTSSVHVSTVEAPEEDFLAQFLQRCSRVDEAEDSASSDKILPSSKWREDIVSSFSMIRTRVERWQYMIESREIRLVQGHSVPKMPLQNEASHWLKFCYGPAWIQLSGSHKSSSPEQKLTNYFLDLYDQVNVKTILADLMPSVPEGKGDGDQRRRKKSSNENDDADASASDTSSGSDDNETADAKSVESSRSNLVLGQKPAMNILMRLTQPQLENLIKCNLLWLTNTGFINECQGQWIYALFACISKPIDPSVMSDLRGIARCLIRVREESCWKAMLEQGEVKDEKLFDFINSLNLLIYIVSDYFQQKDLVMKL